MAVLLGMAASLFWGIGDFLGGAASRRMPATYVVFVASASGLVLIWLGAALLPGEPIGSDLFYGSVGGAFGAGALVVFFWALALGPVRIVATLAAVLAALLPFVTGLALGERPAALALLGSAVALASIPAITYESGERRKATARAIWASVTAGVGFAAFFVALDQVSDASGLWPLVGSRASGSVILAVVLGVRWHGGVDRGSWRMPVLVGVFDLAANVAFLQALRTGFLSLVSVIGSLYPVVTIILARLYFDERINGLQLAGIIGALTGTALIAAG